MGKIPFSLMIYWKLRKFILLHDRVVYLYLSVSYYISDQENLYKRAQKFITSNVAFVFLKNNLMTFDIINTLNGTR